MAELEIISNSQGLLFKDHWEYVPESNKSLVNASGKPVTSYYNGTKYKVVTKASRMYSYSEKNKRILQGILLILFTLGLALIFKKTNDYFSKNKKSILYAVPVISDSSQPENHLIISDRIVSKIAHSMHNILFKKEEKGLNFFKCNERHRVFTLDTEPLFVFKMYCDDNKDSIEEEYQNFKIARKFFAAHPSELLVIPDTTLFEVSAQDKKYKLLASTKLCIDPDEKVQEKYFKNYASQLDEAIREVAVFICKTGLENITWKHIPVLNHVKDERGNRKLALINFRKMDRAHIGLFGGEANQRGLIRCVNQNQSTLIKKIAEDHRIRMTNFVNADASRKRKLYDNFLKN